MSVWLTLGLHIRNICAEKSQVTLLSAAGRPTSGLSVVLACDENGYVVSSAGVVSFTFFVVPDVHTKLLFVTTWTHWNAPGNPNGGVADFENAMPGLGPGLPSSSIGPLPICQFPSDAVISGDVGPAMLKVAEAVAVWLLP